MRGDVHIPKAPGPRVPQTILITIFWDPVVCIIIWEGWICVCLSLNMQSNLHIPKNPGAPGPSTNINYYTFGFVGLYYHFGEFDLFVYQWTCTGNCISQSPRDPRVPKTILIIILWDLVAKIIIWENWICLFICEDARGIAYPKNPGTTGPPKPY